MTVHEPSAANTIKKHQLLVLASLLPLIAAVIASCTHVMLSLRGDAEFSWYTFAAWLTVLVLCTLLTMITAYRYRRSLETWQKVLVLDVGGTFLWYWSFATIYQYLVLNLNKEQIPVNAFAFFWEVPLVGGTASLVSQFQFRKFRKYLKTNHSDDPRKLYRAAETLPFKVMLRNSIAAVAGFSVGATQIAHFTGMATIEIYKDIMLGFVVSIFVSLYYFLVFYVLISPIKSKLMSQYNLKDAIRVRYQSRVLMMIVLLTIGTLLLTTNLYLNNYQKSIHSTVASDIERRFDDVARQDEPLDDPDTLDSLKFGKHGKVFVLDQDQKLPISDLPKSVAAAYASAPSGVLNDYGGASTMIVYRTIDDAKIVSVVKVTDFYGPLLDSLKSLLIAAALVVAIALSAGVLFVSVLSRTLRQLNAAIRNARKTGHYDDSVISTGDEFEAISREFGHFVHETQEHSRRLAEEHARLNASVQSLQLGMIMTDLQGLIINSNTAAQRLLFGRDHSVPDLSALTKDLPHPLALSEYIDKTIKHKKPIRINDVVYGAKYFDVFAAPILAADDSVIGAISVVQDVTEAKVIQRSKDEFFSIASHELRTPLTAIRGNTSMIQGFYQDILSKDQELKTMVGDIHDSSVRLIDIVNDFLDVSRLEQGKMVFKPSEVSLEHVIETVAYDMRSNMRSKDLSLTIDRKTLGTLPKAWIDEGRIKQVLYNLIGNAAKFTEHGGITIKSHLHGDYIKVIIVDTGPGIAPDMQKLLFRKFQQANESLLTRDATKGTGLGLYISRFIVEAMGGRMALDKSMVGVGSEFSFTVPIATEKRINQKSKVSQVDVVTGLSQS